MIARRVIPASLACVLVTLAIARIGRAQAATPEPVDPAAVVVVERWHEALLSAMKQGKAVTFDDRCDALRRVITETHDLDFVARSVVKKYWKELCGEERARYVKIFRELCVGIYADKFDGHSGEEFQPMAGRRLERGSMLVRTRLLRPKKDHVLLDYVLVKRGDERKIVNVVADGVSDLAIKRAEYTSIIEAEGFEGLVTKLEEKVEALPTDSA